MADAAPNSVYDLEPGVIYIVTKRFVDYHGRQLGGGIADCGGACAVCGLILGGLVGAAAGRGYYQLDCRSRYTSGFRFGH
jgi:hypothetical protein